MNGIVEKHPELRALTGARGIAAWFVVLYHIRGAIAGLPPFTLAIFAKGYLAVDFFFLLSGFVIWLTWHDRLRRRGTLAFLRKRIARVWPLHLVTLGCGVALGMLLLVTGRADPIAFPFAELPIHILLLQEWGLSDRLSWNVPAWSISAEAAAYLLFSILFSRLDWRRWPDTALAAMALALLFGLHIGMQGAASLGTDVPRFGALRCIAEFGVGTIIAALWIRRPNTSHWPWLSASSALVAVWIAGFSETLLIPAAFAALLMALALSANHRRNPLEWRAIHYLGRISYATYLGHFLLWRVFKLASVSDASAVPPLGIAAYMIIVLLSSMLLYHLVELPAQHWLAPGRSRSPSGEREAGHISRPARPPVPPSMRSSPPG